MPTNSDQSRQDIPGTQLDGLLAAFRFLTILPLPGTRGVEPRDLAGALPYFPLAGLVIGLILALAARILGPICPAPVLAVLLTAFMAALSGALHLDGLADTADGFASARDREQVLVIMRDSRIGAMGVLALCFVLAIKVAALGSMPHPNASLPLILAPVAGRAAILVHLALLPYVRATGLASVFFAGPRRPAAVLGLFLAAVLGAVAGTGGLAGLGLALLVMLCFGWLCRRRIGGITGDTLGAVCELAEAAVLCGFALNI